MKSETANLPRSLTNNLKITSIAILFLSVYTVIPKTANTTEALTAVTMDSFSTSSEHLTAPTVNDQQLKQIYIPPNYGGPDSKHGSGTR